MIWQTNQFGRVVARTNAYTEIATGLHFRDAATGQWQESAPGFELTPDGLAVARRGQHQVIVSPNVNSADGVVVDLQTPDGQRLRSGILGLNLFDPVSGKSLQVAAVRDVTGTLVSSNEIVWRDAFDGVRADVRVRNRRGQFHQDVVLKEKLSADQLAKLGFDPGTVRLEVWTEFLEAPDPAVTRRVLKSETNATLRATIAEPDEADETLKFGRAMVMGSGSAFVEDQPRRATRVCKQWYQADGRRFLIETVKYRELMPLLEALPVKTAGLKPARSTSGLAASRLPPERVKTAASGTDKTVKMAAVASGALPADSPHVVLDYVLVNGTHTDPFTFQCDTTYFVSDSVELFGTVTIEGGAVIKYAPYVSPALPRIAIYGGLECRTGPYRPCILTARDDDSVGEILPGSTHTPSGPDYGCPALGLMNYGTESLRLEHLHFRYQVYATEIDNYPRQNTVSDVQLVNCDSGLGFVFSHAKLHNALAANVNWAFGAAGFPIEVTHLTAADVANVFGSECAGEPTDPVIWFVTNSAFVNVQHLTWPWLGSDLNHLNGDHNGFYQGQQTPTTFGNNPVTETEPPFHPTVGAGSHYLRDNSPFRDAGTTSINTALLNSLRAKTTFPPDVLNNQTFSTSQTLPPQVPRDSSLLPDIGYHYDPLDYLVHNVAVASATLQLSSGVALGVVAGTGEAGIVIQDGGILISEGSAVNLNHIVRYNAVQEQPSAGFGASGIGSLTGTSLSGLSGQAQLRFTMLGGQCELFGSYGLTSVDFTDCQFYGGSMSVSGFYPDVGAWNVKNCLFARVLLPHPFDAVAATFYNTLFFGGILDLDIFGGSSFTFRDNFFDRTFLYDYGAQLDRDFNGYITGYGWSEGSGVWTPTANDVVLNSFTYAPGPLGQFYQLSTDLQNKGSQSAAEAGLDSYTTRANQTPDSADVDIGFHYAIRPPPTASGTTVPPCRNQAWDITLSGTAPYDDPLTFIKATDPQHGSVGAITPGGLDWASVTYTPEQDYCGPDSFTFKVNDGVLDSAPATVTINVGGANPVANCQDVMTGINTPITFTLSGSDSCGDTLTFNTPAVTAQGGSLSSQTREDANHVSLTYTPPSSTFKGEDGFEFTVSKCGVTSGQVHVYIYVVPEPLLISSCRSDRILLHWGIPKWISDAGLLQEFWIYRCETTLGSSCLPAEPPYATVSDGNARNYTDPGPFDPAKTYCYRVIFRHRNVCYPSSTPEFYPSPLSNPSCNQPCATPLRVLVSGNQASPASSIETYDFRTGGLVNSFVPQHGGNGRGLAIQGTEIFYTVTDDDSIHVCPYGTDGSGGNPPYTDIRTLDNKWRSGVDIQDLAFHNNVLYVLTGYPDQSLQVFKLNPATGDPIGESISIDSPASSNSDGFTVLPNGNFLINDFDGGLECTVYREYSGTTGHLVPGGLVIDLAAFGFLNGTGVATAPDGLSLFFVADIAHSGQTIVQLDLSGNLLGFQPIAGPYIEDMDVVVSQ